MKFMAATAILKLEVGQYLHGELGAYSTGSRNGFIGISGELFLQYFFD